MEWGAVIGVHTGTGRVPFDNSVLRADRPRRLCDDSQCKSPRLPTSQAGCECPHLHTATRACRYRRWSQAAVIKGRFRMPSCAHSNAGLPAQATVTGCCQKLLPQPAVSKCRLRMPSLKHSIWRRPAQAAVTSCRYHRSGENALAYPRPLRPACTRCSQKLLLEAAGTRCRCHRPAANPLTRTQQLEPAGTSCSHKLLLEVAVVTGRLRMPSLTHSNSRLPAKLLSSKAGYECPRSHTATRARRHKLQPFQTAVVKGRLQMRPLTQRDSRLPAQALVTSWCYQGPAANALTRTQQLEPAGTRCCHQRPAADDIGRPYGAARASAPRRPRKPGPTTLI
ncbi:hypothetical protein BGZ61DRAFT_485343 [Ilyonectria robusta]|uniref:uncharacterized protein n=1 Tax=Ilyonectria robusta TaxID=1079257 RepID=UPI001E8EE35D|nr:uncharacterized protein BGZ61DRAFT_485343 [Ilyonectria robusta]KAH8661840.1 hypothetical protein BGZ61DRAFT_485343 [Ilyonectria robusta]